MHFGSSLNTSPRPSQLPSSFSPHVSWDAQRGIFMSSSPFSNTFFAAKPRWYFVKIEMRSNSYASIPCHAKSWVVWWQLLNFIVMQLKFFTQQVWGHPNCRVHFHLTCLEMLKGGFSCLHLHFPTLFLLQNRDDTLSRSRCAQTATPAFRAMLNPG